MQKKPFSIALFLVLSSYILGLVTYRNNLFPLNFYRDFGQSNPASAIFQCPTTTDRFGTVLSGLHFHTDFSDLGILVGDSVIEFVYDPRPYGLDGWVDVALSGQTTQCLLSEIGSYTALSPKEAMLYIGGNDIDRSVPMNEICNNYELIVGAFLESGISLALHEIHYGLDDRRSHALVEGVNDCINRIASEHAIQVIETPQGFRYSDLGEATETSIDGEHLNHKGYAIWMRYLSENLPSIEAGPAL